MSFVGKVFSDLLVIVDYVDIDGVVMLIIGYVMILYLIWMVLFFLKVCGK